MADSIDMVKITAQNAWLSIVIHEGKNREIRKMLESVGHSVLKLKRIKFGFLSLSGLKPGEYRLLTCQEVSRLKKE